MPAGEGEARELLTPSQRLALRDEVKVIVDREVLFYRKVVLSLAAVLGAVFTIVGWTTYEKIQDQTREIVEKLIDRSNSETGVKRTLNNLVGRSVMTASLIALHTPDAAPSDKNITLKAEAISKERNLSFDEWTRLEEWIQEENLEQQDFSSALVVLAAQDEERARHDANSFLGEMLNPPSGSRSAWMRNQPTKRLAILHDFLRPGLESQAFEIAASSEVSRELRFAALDYIKAVRYKDRFDELLPLVASERDDELALRSLLTCAWLDPLDGIIRRESEKVIKGQPSARNVEKAIKLGTTIWYAPSSTSDKAAETIRDEVAKERQELATTLLRFAFDNKARVVVLDGGVVAIFVRSEIGPDDQAFGVQGNVFAKLTPYWSLLKDAATKHDVARIAQLAPWSAARQGLEALQLNLSGTAVIKVSQFREGMGKRLQVDLSESTSLGRLVLARLKDVELRRDKTLTVLWADREGRERQGDLIGLSGDGFDFSLVKEAH